MLKKLWKIAANSLAVLSLTVVTGLAQAAEATQVAPKPPGIGSMVGLPLALIAIFYFLIIRPQNKRQREQKALMNEIALGDEILTSSGILGKITRLRDSYIAITISKDTEVVISRGAV